MLKKIVFWLCALSFTLLNLNAGFAQEVVQKALMIIASDGFRDEELLIPKNMLQTNRVRVVVASSSLSPARGMIGTVIKPDILLSEVKPEDYDAVIFVGGIGAQEFWNDPLAHNIARQAKDAGKIVGAICLAPVILAKAGILEGKKATVWAGAAQELKACKVNYTASDLEIEANIITANGPEAADKFAEAIVKALVQRR